MMLRPAVQPVISQNQLCAQWQGKKQSNITLLVGEKGKLWPDQSSMRTPLPICQALLHAGNY